MTPNLETAVTRYQRRTGPNPDGYVAPDGPTIQRVNAETEAVHGEEESRLPVVPRRKPVISNISSDQVSSLKPDPRYRETENSKTPKIKVAYISKIRRYGALAQEGATLAAEELNDAIFMNPKIEETRRRIQEIEQEIQRRRYGI